MPKRLTITTCDECPHFDNVYYDFAQTCTKLNREIPPVSNIREIPPECPLPDTENT